MKNLVIKISMWRKFFGQITRPLYMRAPQKGTNLIYFHDANKNVSELHFLHIPNGIAAHYEYDAFGNVTKSTRNTTVTGTDYRTFNPFQFSSEYFDSELDLVYYNYRHYNPTSGRFLSRDPIAESGGFNLYAIVRNNAINVFDNLGLWVFHRGITVNSFNDAMEQIGTEWKKRLRTHVTRLLSNGSNAVDQGNMSNELDRHFNRGPNPNGDINDRNYIRMQIDLYTTRLNNISQEMENSIRNVDPENPETEDNFSCDLYLTLLGNLSHSWQDYYAHAVDINYNSSSEPNNRIGVLTGSPENIPDNVKPSSWVVQGKIWIIPYGRDEHGASEPGNRVEPPAESTRRWTNARTFVKDKYIKLLKSWFNTCKCAPEIQRLNQ